MIIADTGPIYALIDASDTWHARVAGWWSENRQPVVIPVTCLAEICYLLGTRISPDAEHAFVKAISEGEFEVEPLEPGDIERAADVMARYSDTALGFTDATVVAMAERLGVREVLTTDRRHFAALKPRHAKRLTLLP